MALTRAQPLHGNNWSHLATATGSVFYGPEPFLLSISFRLTHRRPFLR